MAAVLPAIESEKKDDHGKKPHREETAEEKQYTSLYRTLWERLALSAPSPPLFGTQLELKQKLVCTDAFEWSLKATMAQAKAAGEGQESAPDGLGAQPSTPPLSQPSEGSAQPLAADDPRLLRYVAGVDISFVKEDERKACAGLVVLSFPHLHIVYEKYKMVELTLPYIPSFLAFREADHLLALLTELRSLHPHLAPQLLFVDGNGILHPRGFGLASHLGVLADVPSVGVGKTFFQIDGLTAKAVKLAFRDALQKGDSFLRLKGQSGEVWGAAMRGSEGSTNPIYLSVGHKISLDTAIEVVLASCLHRIPEPIRTADLGSRQFLREQGFNRG